MLSLAASSSNGLVAPLLPVEQTAVDGASPAQALASNRLDELLLQSIAGGDKYAMRVLFQRHNVRVYRFVLRLVRNPSLAEDIVSDVFLVVWKDAGRFKAEAQVTTWLLAIARHKAMSALRRRAEAQLDDHAAAGIVDPRDDPETRLDKQDRSKIIQKCLTRLSPSHREIIDLVYYHGKLVREVAQIVGVPEGTVKTRMFHARRHMSKLLAAAGIREAC
jgi:RNA polymerase sigma-70 factor (ECF subfamily)